MARLTTVALISVISMGVCGNTAAAPQVINGDADDGLTGWTADPALTTSMVDQHGQVDSSDPGNDGGYFFDFAGAAVGDNGTASLSQSVPVYPCGIEYLEGSMSVDYIYSTHTSDVGMASAQFDGEGPIEGDANLITPDNVWMSGTLGPVDVPTGANMLEITFVGEENPAADGTGSFANVGFDKVVVNTNGCASGYAKVSGKVVIEDIDEWDLPFDLVDGFNVKRGVVSWAGAFGADLATGDAIGEMYMNVKALGYWCTLTPDVFVTLEFDELAGATGTAYCETYDGLESADDLPWLMALNSADTSTSNKDKNKDRGWVRIWGLLPVDGVTLVLTHGNVIVNSDTSDD